MLNGNFTLISPLCRGYSQGGNCCNATHTHLMYPTNITERVNDCCFHSFDGSDTRNQFSFGQKRIRLYASEDVSEILNLKSYSIRRAQ